MQDFLTNLWSIFPAPMQEKLSGYLESFWKILPNLIFATLFLFVVWAVVFAAKIVARRLTRRLRSNLQDVAVLLTKVTLWTLGLLIAATIAFPTLSIANMFAAAGVGGLAVAFAARDMLENFFAGVSLLVRKTFDDGDYVECEGIEGQVERIAMRETLIRQTDGQLVVAPNKLFFQNPLTIRTNRDVRRTTVICGVAYKEDVDTARDVIEQAVAACDTVLKDDLPIQIFAQEFADSAINFEVTWWTRPKPVDIRRSRDQVVASVKRALDDAGIEIPFPYRTLTFDEPLKMGRDDDDSVRDAA
ncbi:mechanosensitive ion channel family protein [uncultured Tateyamaria sp.]|uniref:mechanosensitive ion channel family protein n=1 Tax=uncultured Tateyamaria sp. TaxID=455651 RepID=UPI002634E413|nr:mechanosensitive ion channel family protein [uncultured Tateyamaria sp.]